MEALPEIVAAGGRLVVVTPQDTARAATWREELGLAKAILVLADPRRTLYAALGARRPAPLWMLRPRVVGAGLRAIAARERVSVTRGDDTLQQGVDVVTDAHGGIAFVHRASDPADRTPPDELVGVLRGLGHDPSRSSAPPGRAAPAER